MQIRMNYFELFGWMKKMRFAARSSKSVPFNVGHTLKVYFEKKVFC